MKETYGTTIKPLNNHALSPSQTHINIISNMQSKNRNQTKTLHYADQLHSLPTREREGYWVAQHGTQKHETTQTKPNKYQMNQMQTLSHA